MALLSDDVSSKRDKIKIKNKRKHKYHDDAEKTGKIRKKKRHLDVNLTHDPKELIAKDKRKEKLKHKKHLLKQKKVWDTVGDELDQHDAESDDVAEDDLEELFKRLTTELTEDNNSDVNLDDDQQFPVIDRLDRDEEKELVLTTLRQKLAQAEQAPEPSASHINRIRDMIQRAQSYVPSTPNIKVASGKAPTHVTEYKKIIGPTPMNSQQIDSAKISKDLEKSESEFQLKYLRDRAILESYGKYPRTADVLRQIGIDPYFGPFSKDEHDRIMSFYNSYLEEHGLTQEQGIRLVTEYTKFTTEYGKAFPDFYFRLSLTAPYRVFHYTFHHINRYLNPRNKRRAKWTDDEQFILLQKYRELGNQWTKIADHVGRMDVSCLVKMRNIEKYLVDGYLLGRWSSFELNELLQLIKQCTLDKGKNLTDTEDINWQKISDKLLTRSAQQCRAQWIHRLRPLILSDGFRYAFTKSDERELLFRLCELHVTDERYINWVELGSKDQWSRQWPSGKLLSIWRRLRNRVESWRQKRFTDILFQLVQSFETQESLGDERVAFEVVEAL